jgi:hypothetical protein
VVYAKGALAGDIDKSPFNKKECPNPMIYRKILNADDWT